MLLTNCKKMNKINYFIVRIFSPFIIFFKNGNIYLNVIKAKNVKIKSKYILINVSIDDYSYIGSNSNLRNVTIGKFCSIGPNCLCGLAKHPTNGISTSPIFYSTLKQCGTTLCTKDKIEEHGKVIIGNDVFIGANVSILSNVRIGDGAVIAAGSVVINDVPDYAIVGGVPTKIIKYRFSDEIIASITKIKWWDLPIKDLKKIEENFFDIDSIIDLYSK